MVKIGLPAHLREMDELKKTIGNRIRSCRLARGLSQQELALNLGRSTVAMSNIERGRSFPSVETLLKAAEVLECEVRDFFEGLETDIGKSDRRLRLEGEMWGLLFAMSDRELAAVVKAAKALMAVRD